MTDTLLTHDGITQPVTEWALDYGIYPNVITDRLARGWSTERAITAPMIVAPRQRLDSSHLPGLPKLKRKSPLPKPDRGKLITHAGCSLTVRGWSETLGITIHTIRNRIAAGWSIEHVLGPAQRTGLIEHGGFKFTLEEWSERTGIAASTIRRRIKDGWRIEHALSAGNMSGKCRPGVGKNFAAPKGTGGGSVAQDIPQIEFSE